MVLSHGFRMLLDLTNTTLKHVCYVFLLRLEGLRSLNDVLNLILHCFRRFSLDLSKLCNRYLALIVGHSDLYLLNS